ncbi:MAG: DNA-3-methyladenine glycosylase I, partial [Nanoarchaeota archaeon]
MKRCAWASNNPINKKYHDKEWGIEVHNEKKLFEMLILEGAQAGLSWLTILKKRKNYRKAFDNFNYKKIAKYEDKKIQELLENKGIIRNKLKIKSTIQNAKIFIKIQKEFGSFNKYIWSFVKNKPIKNNYKTHKQIPSKTELSDKISKDLKKRGMSFVGSTIIYAFMQ